MYNQSFTNIAILPERDFNKSAKTITENKNQAEHDKFSHYRKFSTYETNDYNKDKNHRGLIEDKRAVQCHGEEDNKMQTGL